ncbi:MAG: PilZ domain-containing protein [Nitrospirae bacterium]|nr:PilZ domain-containing protein [Nitrospirota bacterium]
MGIFEWLKTTFWQQKETVDSQMTSSSIRNDQIPKSKIEKPKAEQPPVPDYPQKRRYKRFAVKGKKLITKFALADVIELFNISISGACIITTKTLKPGDNVLLKLPTDKVSSPLKCTIIWERASDEHVEKDNSMTLHKTGLRFSEIDSSTLIGLKDFMRIAGIPCDQRLEDNFQPNPLRFSILSGEKAMLNYPVTSPVKTISQGGMLVEANCDFQSEQRYPMALYLPHNDQPIKFQGRIASKMPHDDVFDIGIEFLEMKEADRARLQSFIETLRATN